LFATPIVSLADLDRAVELLEWALARGCRAIDLRAAPVPTRSGMRSPADPMFDPFWARCAEADVLVCTHLGESGYYRYSGDWTGNYRRRAFSLDAFEQVYLHGRAVSDFMTAMVCQGAFTRHPGLRVVSVENGSDWVANLVERLKLYYHRYPGSFPEDPVAAWNRCVWVNPYWEDDLAALTEYVPVERILAGSDFPHAEGLAEPTDFVKGLVGFSPEDERRIMRDNLKSLLGH
jgi:predicted TIM-barrel fold metal-dependent hydrolase